MKKLIFLWSLLASHLLFGFEVSSEQEQVSTLFKEVTCRIPSKEIIELNAKLDTLPEKERWVQEIMIFENFGEPVFKNPNYPYYALLALKKSKITQEQFGSIQLYWTTCQAFAKTEPVQILESPNSLTNEPMCVERKTLYDGSDKVEVFPLFDEQNHANPRAMEYMQQTIVPSPDIGPPDLGPILSKEELEEAINALRNSPKSEQFFLLVDDTEGDRCPSPSNIFEATIGHAIRKTGFNLLGHCRALEDQTKQKRIIPSISLMQAVIDIKFKKNAIKINPVIGISSQEQIKRLDLRDLTLDFPDIQRPKRADYYRAPFYEFALHDFYHAFSASSIPYAYREMRSRIADVADALHCNSGDERKYLEIFSAIAIDMQSSFFRPDACRTNNAEWDDLKFFFDLWLIFNKVMSVHFLPHVDSKAVRERLEETIVKTWINSEGTLLIEKVLNDLTRNFQDYFYYVIKPDDPTFPAFIQRMQRALYVVSETKMGVYPMDANIEAAMSAWCDAKRNNMRNLEKYLAENP